jgi:hypothetical protein
MTVCQYSCLSYPTCKSHFLYSKQHYNCRLWPVRLYHIFRRYLINGTTFGEKKVTEHKMCVCARVCVVFFSTTFV